jgi:hypothetical protein
MATKQHIIRIRTMLSRLGLNSLKDDMVLGFTNGRTSHISEMTDAEALEMAANLQAEINKENEKGKAMNRMRRTVISTAYEMGWATPGDWKTAIQRIDEFNTGSHGKYKKKMQEHSYDELVNLVTQFRQTYKKHLNAL